MYGPTRNAYGPTTNINKYGKIFSKMSHESKHSESEFYYPGELFHAELLQSPTHSENKETEKFNTPRKWRSSQLSQKPTSKQAVKETTFPDKLSDR